MIDSKWLREKQEQEQKAQQQQQVGAYPSLAGIKRGREKASEDRTPNNNWTFRPSRHYNMRSTGTGLCPDGARVLFGTV